jgi:hypothetical protein
MAASALLSLIPLHVPFPISAYLCSYGPQWEAHVLSNLPFYLTLLPLFLEASLPRVEVGWAGPTVQCDVCAMPH